MYDWYWYGKPSPLATTRLQSKEGTAAWLFTLRDISRLTTGSYKRARRIHAVPLNRPITREGHVLVDGRFHNSVDFLTQFTITMTRFLGGPTMYRAQVLALKEITHVPRPHPTPWPEKACLRKRRVPYDPAHLCRVVLVQNVPRSRPKTTCHCERQREKVSAKQQSKMALLFLAGICRVWS